LFSAKRRTVLDNGGVDRLDAPPTARTELTGVERP
jgi:hypothetical protein